MIRSPPRSQFVVFTSAESHTSVKFYTVKKYIFCPLFSLIAHLLGRMY